MPWSNTMFKQIKYGYILAKFIQRSGDYIAKCIRHNSFVSSPIFLKLSAYLFCEVLISRCFSRDRRIMSQLEHYTDNKFMRAFSHYDIQMYRMKLFMVLGAYNAYDLNNSALTVKAYFCFLRKNISQSLDCDASTYNRLLRYFDELFINIKKYAQEYGTLTASMYEKSRTTVDDYVKEYQLYICCHNMQRDFYSVSYAIRSLKPRYNICFCNFLYLLCQWVCFEHIYPSDIEKMSKSTFVSNACAMLLDSNYINRKFFRSESKNLDYIRYYFNTIECRVNEALSKHDHSSDISIASLVSGIYINYISSIEGTMLPLSTDIANNYTCISNALHDSYFCYNHSHA